MITPLTLGEMEAMSKEEVENHVMVLQMEAERKQRQVHNLRERVSKHNKYEIKAIKEICRLNGNNFAETAKIFDMPESTVKNMVEGRICYRKDSKKEEE